MAYVIDEHDSSKLLLSSINTLLQTINELPIETADDLANYVTAQLAEMTIDEVKKEVLSQGWHFNTDKNYPFPPDLSGVISIPYNVLDIVSSSKTDIVMRDWKLYDKANQTFEFTEAEDCDVVWNMDFNSLTHPLRHYITIKASRVFQARQIGDQIAYAYSKDDEESAYLSAKFSEARTGKYNVLESQEFGLVYGGIR